eukprot:4719589-Pleurochrysis_carterae.AAC.5
MSNETNSSPVAALEGEIEAALTLTTPNGGAHTAAFCPAPHSSTTRKFVIPFSLTYTHMRGARTRMEHTKEEV